MTPGTTRWAEKNELPEGWLGLPFTESAGRQADNTHISDRRVTAHVPGFTGPSQPSGVSPWDECELVRYAMARALGAGLTGCVARCRRKTGSPIRT
jgi:hypothetical protein